MSISPEARWNWQSTLIVLQVIALVGTALLGVATIRTQGEVIAERLNALTHQIGTLSAELLVAREERNANRERISRVEGRLERGG